MTQEEMFYSLSVLHPLQVNLFIEFIMSDYMPSALLSIIKQKCKEENPVLSFWLCQWAAKKKSGQTVMLFIFDTSKIRIVTEKKLLITEV